MVSLKTFKYKSHYNSFVFYQRLQLQLIENHLLLRKELVLNVCVVIFEIMSLFPQQDQE